jgi:hypothetical protein
MVLRMVNVEITECISPIEPPVELVADQIIKKILTRLEIINFGRKLNRSLINRNFTMIRQEFLTQAIMRGITSTILIELVNKITIEIDEQSLILGVWPDLLDEIDKVLLNRECRECHIVVVPSHSKAKCNINIVDALMAC